MKTEHVTLCWSAVKRFALIIFKSAAQFLWAPATDPVVLLGRPWQVSQLMPGSPYRVVCVGLQIVVCGELAYVAAIACRVEGIDRLPPMDRLI